MKLYCGETGAENVAVAAKNVKENLFFSRVENVMHSDYHFNK